MDCPQPSTNYKNIKKSKKKFNAIHLLPEVDEHSVIKYINDFSRRYFVKRSQLKFECLLCNSMMNSWNKFLEHMKEPSHLHQINDEKMNFTAICIFCKYILMTEDVNLILDHFSFHRENTSKKEIIDTVHKITSRKCNKRVITNLHSEVKDSCNSCLDPIVPKLNQLEVTGKHCESGLQTVSGARDFCKSILKTESYDIDHNVNLFSKMFDNLSIMESLSNRKKEVPSAYQGFTPASLSLKEEEKSGPSKYVVTVYENVFPENSIYSSDKEEMTFFPKKAVFSKSAFQLISPGVENDFITTQDLNALNIEQFIAETYYLIYHFLRKLYFSCLICNSVRLQKDNFYLHLKGKKHKSKIINCEESTFYIKICDVCQQFLFGSITLLTEHFGSDVHLLNMKYKMDFIKEQYFTNSGNFKLGWSGELTAECISMFSSKKGLNDWIESSLQEADCVVSKASSLNRRLKRDIMAVLRKEYCNLEIEFVGSRAYGLAKHNSDADIHLNIGNVSVEDLEKHFSKAVGLFIVRRTIKDAKVPIIRVEHISSALICDINCSNPTGLYSSELINTYISLDPRVRWVVMAIREWATANGIRGTKKFTSYGLTWLVLFFLMSPAICLIPPVKTLKYLYKGGKVIINGWDYSFTREIEEIKQTHNPLLCNLNKYELLGRFFQCYSSLDTKKLVLFPHDGMLYAKSQFASPYQIIHPLLHNNPEDKEPMKVGGHMMIMDSFCLRENILKSVDENLADHFKLICQETLRCGWWS